MTDYTRAEAELDAKREEGEKRVAKMKDEVISNPVELCDALNGSIGNKNQKNLFFRLNRYYYLIGLLYEQGMSIEENIDKSPVEPLLQDQINDTVKELAEHVEAMVEMYLEENSDDA